MTVSSWCQISHRKCFGEIYPAFKHSYAIILWWILAQNIHKWCVWFTSANRLKRGKAVYFQFITMTVASWRQISHIKSFGAIYPAFEHSYASFYDGFWLQNIQNDVVWFTSANPLKRDESQFICNLLTMTVGSWCQISHRKSFWCNISSIWIQLCIILW